MLLTEVARRLAVWEIKVSTRFISLQHVIKVISALYIKHLTANRVVILPVRIIFLLRLSLSAVDTRFVFL